MQFSWLEGVSKKWKEILVIGRTMERDGKRAHIIGMTLEEEAKIYLIEPYEEQKRRNRKKKCTQRMLAKEQETTSLSYLHCQEFMIGNKKLHTQGGAVALYCPKVIGKSNCFLI